MTEHDRRAHIEDATRLPQARRHLDEARTYLIEATDGEAGDGETCALAALASAHLEAARTELLLAETADAVDEASAMVEDRLLWSLSLDIIPERLIQPLLGGGQRLADELDGPPGGYAIPSGVLRTILHTHPEEGPELIAAAIGGQVVRYQTLTWLVLPGGQWQEIAAGIRDLVDWHLGNEAQEDEQEEPAEDEEG